MFDEKKNVLKQYRVLQTKIQRLETMMEKFPEKADKYRVLITNCKRLRDSIEDRIDAVDGNILSEILSQKYICGRSLEEISYYLNYSKRQTERLHLRALENFCIQNFGVV